MYRTRKFIAVLVTVIMAVAFLPCISASADITYSDFAFDSDSGTITRYLGEGTNVAIPSEIGGVSVTAIAEHAFEGSSIKGVSIPSTVKTIGNYAFSNCFVLTRAYIPSNVTTIGTGAFDGCGLLTIYYSSTSSAAYKYAGNNGIPRQSGTATTATIKFNANGGEVSPESKTVIRTFDYGELPVPIRSGYFFEGWWTSSSGGSEITRDSVVSASATSQTLYARWVSTTMPIVITNAASNITSSSAKLSVTLTTGTNVVSFDFEVEDLDTDTPSVYSSKSNSAISPGRYGVPVGDLSPGTHYRYRATATDSRGIKGYGEWVHFMTLSEDPTVTVTFNVNGGNSLTSADRTKVVTVGKAYGTLPTPTRSNYTFAGWYTASSGGTQVAETSPVTVTTDHTLYARWVSGKNPVQATVTTLDAVITEKDDGFYASMQVRLDSMGTYPVTTMGYEVLNTSTGELKTLPRTSDASYVIGTIYPLSAKITPNVTFRYRGYATSAAGTVYGEWKEFNSAGLGKSLTVTFDVNGGSSLSTADKTKTVYQGSVYGDMPTPTRSNYTFIGWYTAKSGGTLVTEETTVTSSSNHTLYAHWKSGTLPTIITQEPKIVDTNKVTLGGMLTSKGSATVTGLGFIVEKTTTGKSSEVKMSGSSYEVSAKPYEHILTISNASGETYRYRAYATNSVGTVYGEWKSFVLGAPTSYTVTFNANGGSVSPASKSVTVDQPYGTLPTPTYSGHVFDGWYTQAVGGTLVTEATTVTTAADHTLYAHWTAEKPSYSAALTVDTVSSFPGGVVTVPIRISDNPGLSMLMLTVGYDKTRLTPISITQGDILKSGSLTSNIQQGGDLTSYDNITAFWSGSANATGDGVILNVTFMVKPGTAPGSVPVTVTVAPGGAANKDGSTVELTVTNGGIDIIDPAQKDYTVLSLGCEFRANGGSAYAEATVRKNTDRDAKDTIVIAVYKDGKLIDMTYMKGQFAKDQTVTFGGRVTTEPGSIVKAFVWDSLDGMQSLSNSQEILAGAATAEIEAMIEETVEAEVEAAAEVEAEIEVETEVEATVVADVEYSEIIL